MPNARLWTKGLGALPLTARVWDDEAGWNRVTQTNESQITAFGWADERSATEIDERADRRAASRDHRRPTVAFVPRANLDAVIDDSHRREEKGWQCSGQWLVSTDRAADRTHSAGLVHSHPRMARRSS